MSESTLIALARERSEGDGFAAEAARRVLEAGLPTKKTEGFRFTPLRGVTDVPLRPATAEDASADAAVLRIVNGVPQLEGFDAPEWEPSVESLAMTRQGNRASLSVIRPHLARLEYKYTRGSWDTVEGTLDCGNIDDRALIVDCFNGQITVQDEVLNWVDLCDP